ncbi:hypothetical protein M378DRAFT_25108 [Amanita muscaria Koide BX008]|uniref:DUF6534 domain-containing protein n=1 Tax=Amanita muscaria (strain Koide BX008) TaxID=946122 RepID=A0A0C2X3M8_AMAMK|nr:hypothetical protein M378DRAFT_25108 [Amanita muscaria Koide BX008]
MSMSLVNTHGAVLLGTLVATFLSGMNTLQTVVYFRLYPNDPKRINALVAAIWCLDVIHTAFIWVYMWSLFIENFGQASQIDVIQKDGSGNGGCFWDRDPDRPFVLFASYLPSCRNYWVTTPILVLIICRVCGTIATMVGLYKSLTLSGFAASKYGWVLSLGFVFNAAADIAIMLTMFVLLRLSRQRSIRFGSTTTLAMICKLTKWFARPHTLIFLALYIPLAKVYGMAFLGSLNSRYHFRQAQGPPPSQGWVLSTLPNLNQTPIGSTSSGSQDRPIHFNVRKSSWYDGVANIEEV